MPTAAPQLTQLSLDDLLAAHRADHLLFPIDHEIREGAQEGIGPEVLVAIAAGLAGTVDPGALTFEGRAERSYVRLLQTARYDAWLIAWAPAADLDLHDHGGSAGAFHVVKGKLIEAHTDRAERRPLQTIKLNAGSSRPVTSTRVHRVWNPGPHGALSVHVYSPPLRAMNFYDDQPGSFLTRIRTEPVRSDAPEAGA